MNSRLILATLVATLVSVNFVMAQNPTEGFENLVANNESSQLNFPNDSSDFGTVQERYSDSAALFKTGTQAASPDSGNAQREIVTNTLTLMGAALLISMIVVGTFVYSNRRDQFGERRPPRSDWS